ncbi:uncharacterized protein LTR77_006527 [Saxophila tyrrhenica]|uniref:PLC-like phosphodiesterase n=1 Tax=Saxophila tyrrhenica TaxID=1690608 RepID=A0AAV9P4V7_9PEZI|nr:hypothetical protein LTR77_006527 [Saxophila tyrrhenica]
MLLFVALLAGLLALTNASPIGRPRDEQQVCNGSADVCSRKYSDMSFIGTHNSAFVGDIDDLRVNQRLSVTEQLDAGVRFLQAQMHRDDFGRLSMCHTSCWLFYAGSLEDYLKTIKTWLASHSDAVVTLLLTNGDSVSASDIGDVVKSTGLKDYAFVPSSSPKRLAMSDWPTLGDMVSNDSRFVMFLDYGADESSTPFILDEFHYFFETPYDVTDPSFSQCSIDRPPNAKPDDRMYIVNHFLDKEVFGSDDVLVPDTDANFETNAATGPGSIGAQVGRCEEKHGRTPNVVLLDMFDRGNWMDAQVAMNAS